MLYYNIPVSRLGTTKHLIMALGLAYCLFVAIDGIYIKLVVRQHNITSKV